MISEYSREIDRFLQEATLSRTLEPRSLDIESMTSIDRIMGSWLPISLTCEPFNREISYLSVKISRRYIKKLDKTVFFLFFKNYESGDHWPKSSLPFLLKYFNVNSYLAAQKFKNNIRRPLLSSTSRLDKKVSIMKEAKSDTGSTPHQNGDYENSSKKIDSNLHRKYGSNSGDFEILMKSTKQGFVHSDELLIPHQKKNKDENLKNEGIKRERTILERKKEKKMESIHSLSIEDSNANRENGNEAMKLGGFSNQPSKITDFFQKEDINSNLMKHSRFIHHNINFKGIKRLVTTMFIPIIIFLSYTITIYNVETSYLTKFQGISADLAALDSCDYDIWAITLLPQYIDIKRMVIEGILDIDSFQKYGISNLTDHINNIKSSQTVYTQLNYHFLRLRRSIMRSKFTEKYDKDVIERSMVIVDMYNNGSQQFSSIPVKTYDGLRITGEYINLMMMEIEVKGVIGDAKNRRNSPFEEMMRYNSFNPALSQLFKSE